LKKIIWENIATIHSVLKKNYKAKFSISSILKKIKSIEIILEKNKKKEKNNIGNTVAIYSVL
jgi:hypothetical protein